MVSAKKKDSPKRNSKGKILTKKGRRQNQNPKDIILAQLADKKAKRRIAVKKYRQKIALLKNAQENQIKTYEKNNEILEKNLNDVKELVEDLKLIKDNTIYTSDNTMVTCNEARDPIEFFHEPNISIDVSERAFISDTLMIENLNSICQTPLTDDAEVPTFISPEPEITPSFVIHDIDYTKLFGYNSDVFNNCLNRDPIELFEEFDIENLNST